MATDGNLQNQAVATKTLLLPPGARLEVLVYGPPNGTYQLQDAAFSTGPAGDQYPGAADDDRGFQGIAGGESDPHPAAAGVPQAAGPAQGDDQSAPDHRLRRHRGPEPVLHQRQAVHCVDAVAKLGDVEEWTIQNTAQEAHVFHIHQLDFQVTEVNGKPEPFLGYHDVITLPAAASDADPSVVKVIIPFTDPVILGEFVYHCHIIQHEDQGMMSNILVIDPTRRQLTSPCVRPRRNPNSSTHEGDQAASLGAAGT
jgi:FtsP/CotA-like multicopper oxidase with cupredoxin domain